MRSRWVMRLVTCAALMTAGFAIPASPAQAAFCENVAFKSTANNRYVSAELGYGGNEYGMLRARAAAVGPWERFQICHYTSVVSGGLFYWSTLKSLANGRYVSVDHGATGAEHDMLRAGWATSIGEWEQFQIDAGNPDAKIRAVNFFRWTSAELGYGGGWNGMLRARATDVGPWEQFDFVAA